MTSVDDAVRDGPARLSLAGHVDREAVDVARYALQAHGGRAVLDLAPVRSWGRDAVPALTAVLETAGDGLVVVPAPATSFLGLLEAVDVRGVWAVYDDVRDLRRAAQRRTAPPAAPIQGPPTPRPRVFGPSQRHAGAPTLGLHRRRIEEEP